MKPLTIVGIGVGVCAVTGIVMGAYVWQRSAVPRAANPNRPVSAAPTPTPALTTWTDPAGFSFQYPDGITLNKHDEDKENYAHVELTSSGHLGSLIVWAKDLPKGVTDTASWVKDDKRFAGANMLDTTLGSTPAKKILVSSPTKQLVTGTVTDGLLFMIEAALSDDGYWSGIHDTVVSTFAFGPEQKTSGDASGAADGGTDEPVDEEEVVQ